MNAAARAFVLILFSLVLGVAFAAPGMASCGAAQLHQASIADHCDACDEDTFPDTSADPCGKLCAASPSLPAAPAAAMPGYWGRSGTLWAVSPSFIPFSPDTPSRPPDLRTC